MLLDPPLVPVLTAGAGEVEVVDLLVPAQWAGRSMDDLVPAEAGRVSVMTRRGRAMIPEAQARLELGDRLVVSVTQHGLRRLKDSLGVQVESA